MVWSESVGLRGSWRMEGLQGEGEGLMLRDGM